MLELLLLFVDMNSDQGEEDCYCQKRNEYSPVQSSTLLNSNQRGSLLGAPEEVNYQRDDND